MQPDQRESFISTLRCEQHSRVPFFPRDLTLGLDALKVNTDMVFGPGRYDAKLSAECVLELQKMLGHDCTVGCISTYGLEAFGGVTKFPKDGIPYVSQNPFANEKLMEDYNPSQITDCYLFKGMRESCEIVRKKRPDLALFVNIPGPMTMAGFMRGVEQLMMDLMMNPDLAAEILVFSVEAIANEMVGLTDGIADGVFFASTTDNPDMIGDDFLEHSVPGIRVLNDLAHRDGYLTIFHPHGVFSTEDRAEYLDAALAAGADGFQFSESNDPESIGDACRGRCCVLGGLDSYTSLLLGPEKRIRRDTMSFIDTFRDDPYIMTCSCSVNRGLPLDNLRIMADQIAEYNGGMR